MNGLNGLELAELRHRLFGNFQLLQALIAIRLRGVKDPESRRHLNWLTDVVAALALINRRLAASDSSDFSAYLIETISFWRRVCAGREIGFVFEASPVILPDRFASSLALIAHELIANAVEHAFPDARPGRSSVTLVEKNSVLELAVADNGAGRSLDTREDSEGLGLVQGLTEHLGGTFESAVADGVTITVRVPLGGSRLKARPRAH